jgi:hypothetical protein
MSTNPEYKLKSYTAEDLAKWRKTEEVYEITCEVENRVLRLAFVKPEWYNFQKMMNLAARDEYSKAGEIVLANYTKGGDQEIVDNLFILMGATQKITLVILKEIPAFGDSPLKKH